MEVPLGRLCVSHEVTPTLRLVLSICLVLFGAIAMFAAPGGGIF